MIREFSCSIRQKWFYIFFARRYIVKTRAYFIHDINIEQQCNVFVTLMHAHGRIIYLSMKKREKNCSKC